MILSYLQNYHLSSITLNPTFIGLYDKLDLKKMSLNHNVSGLQRRRWLILQQTNSEGCYQFYKFQSTEPDRELSYDRSMQVTTLQECGITTLGLVRRFYAEKQSTLSKLNLTEETESTQNRRPKNA